MSLKILIVIMVSLVLVFSTVSSWSQPAEPVQVDNSAQPNEDLTAEETPQRQNLFPDDISGLEEMADQAYEDGEYLRFVQAMIKLRELRPFEPDFMIGMVVGGALIGRPTTAYNYMHVMQQQGLSYDFNKTEATRSIRSTEVYEYLNGLLIKAGEPMGEGRVAFRLAETKMQPEAIAWDAGRGKFLIGTIDSGAVLAVTPGGEVEELLRSTDKNGLLAIGGIAVDAAHKRLWITTAGVPGFDGVLPTDLGRGALMEFDLETLELLQRYDVPVDGMPHVPGSIAITPAGDVYLIDRAVAMVFRKKAGVEKLEPYLASRELEGLTDLALSDSGDKLYLADSALGIMVVDLGKETSAMLNVTETLNLTGISGLMFSEGSLLVLQNGIRPQRLMRINLDNSGVNVVNFVPLAIALEDFVSPSFGVIQGGAVYYFAGGNLPGVTSVPAPVVVLKTPIELSEAIVPAEQRKYKEDVLEKQKKNSG